MIPATVRPLPTPAPSPIRKPALWLFWRITSCCWWYKRSKCKSKTPTQLHYQTWMVLQWVSCLCAVCWCVYLAGIDDSLELQSRQQAAVYSRLGDKQIVCDVRRRDTGQCVGFYHYVRMRNSFRGWTEERIKFSFINIITLKCTWPNG